MGQGKKGSGKCTGTEREKEGAGSGSLKVAGSGRKRRKNTTLHNILQLREAKTWELTKIGQEPGIKDTGRGML